MMRGNPKGKRTLNVAFLILMISLTVAPLATAGDITIFDKMGTNTVENNEVEPGCVALQKWDLEAFYLKGSKLYMIGGFNFLYGSDGYKSGDIFISTQGVPIYGSTPRPSSPLNGGEYGIVANGYKYNYVIDFARNGSGDLIGTYDVISLTGSSLVSKSYFSQNEGSNPFQYVSGGNTLFSSIAYTYYGGQTGQDVKNLLGDPSFSLDETGIWGGTHNVLMIDLAFLGYGQEFYAHFTEGCGNDDLMGHGTTPVPEPGTMILLGSGLVGLAGWGRKKYRKKPLSTKTNSLDSP